MLSLTLASESFHKMDGPVSESNVLLSYFPKFLSEFRSVFIEFKGEVRMPVTATIHLMRCCLYMKILCKELGPKHLASFVNHFNQAGIFPSVIEQFEEYSSKSKLLSLKIMHFVTYMINDIHSLYFDNLSGVRMDAMLGYASLSEENQKDTEILLAQC